MAQFLKQGNSALQGVKKFGRFDTGLGKRLPEAYRKFWREWRETTPTAVHYIPKEGKFERNERTGVVTPVQNLPLPARYPKEFNHGIWGGELVVQGFVKRNPYKQRVPHFWMPRLRRVVLKSEVLNMFMSVVVTERTMDLVHSSHGFDHYLLKTLACDLGSNLAVSIKRKILHELQAGCPSHEADPKRQQEVLDEYSRYLEQYTPEEIEWYGLTFSQALGKLHKSIAEANPIVPHKVLFRARLIEQLREVQNKIAEKEETPASHFESTSWLTKVNPFGKKRET
ncbi:large ribosomal subunit protein bL28m [Phlebotomus argentipes]|uniref:large ribosomal subunit protein bL28m n=1 Tax=Phlebotomus argentipes TaxID=94469 RepID=UPI00289298ED|nr:large ribosomal subunit protein bL28m [Phlebotomus argentipes]